MPFSQYNREVAPEAKEDIEVKAAAGHFDIYRYILRATSVYFLQSVINYGSGYPVSVGDGTILHRVFEFFLQYD